MHHQLYSNFRLGRLEKYNKMHHQLYNIFWFSRLENITKCIYASSALSTATLFGLWGWNV
jgi:hypothetical protein